MLSDIQRNKILGLADEGLNVTKISRKTGHTRNTVYRVLGARKQAEKTVQDQQRSPTRNIENEEPSYEKGTSTGIQEQTQSEQSIENESAPKNKIDLLRNEFRTSMQKLETGIQKMQGIYDLITDSIQSKNSDPKNENPSVENVKVLEGSIIERKLFLTAKFLVLYDITVKDGYPGNLSEFINDVIDKYFKSKDMTLGILRRQEI